MSELRAFKDAILVRNVVARVLRANEPHESMDFSSPEAFKEYLLKHPHADKSKHRVVNEKGEAGSAGAHTTTKVDKDLAGDIAKHWKGPEGNAVDAVRKMVEEGRDVPHNMLDKAVHVLHDQANKPGLDPEKAKAYRMLRDKLKKQGTGAHDPARAKHLDHAVDWWINQREHGGGVKELAEQLGGDEATAQHMEDSYKKLPPDKRRKFMLPENESDTRYIENTLAQWYDEAKRG